MAATAVSVTVADFFMETLLSYRGCRAATPERLPHIPYRGVNVDTAPKRW
jgi:hypothetical protein